MKIIKVNKDGSCSPTLYGKCLEFIFRPLFWFVKDKPVLYAKIYNKFLKGNWFRLVVFIRIQKM